MIERVVFVYVNGQQVRCEYIDEAEKLEEAQEWEHVATLEPKAYIQSLLLECPTLISRLRGLVNSGVVDRL